MKGDETTSLYIQITDDPLIYIKGREDLEYKALQLQEEYGKCGLEIILKQQ